jgi:hypothetical protein
MKKILMLIVVFISAPMQLVAQKYVVEASESGVILIGHFRGQGQRNYWKAGVDDPSLGLMPAHLTSLGRMDEVRSSDQKQTGLYREEHRYFLPNSDTPYSGNVRVRDPRLDRFPMKNDGIFKDLTRALLNEASDALSKNKGAIRWRGTLLNGEWHGTRTEYSDATIVRAMVDFQNGERHGRYIEYWDEGRDVDVLGQAIQLLGEFRKGIQCGTWERWNRKGSVTSTKKIPWPC